MDLLHTIQMLKLANQNVKVLHIEPTDACNATCPQCLRETDDNFNKAVLHHLSVNNIKELIDVDTILNLDKMFMCGNYGDPAAGKYTLEIYRYFRKINPKIILGMNTNGGLRSTEWWQELAGILNQPNDYVVFSIDGLVDTNHIYRINVDYKKVINNACGFIHAGGSAHWDMIVFAHNEHQVTLAQETAHKLGFKWFRAKVSKRHGDIPIDFLHAPAGWKNPIVTSASIKCHALKESSVYISAQGEIYPCCWLGDNSNHKLDTFDTIKQNWIDDPLVACVKNCGSHENQSSFTNQWQREVEFQKIA